MPWAEKAWAVALLTPLAWAYRLGWALGKALRRGPAWRPPVPVLSVGNLSVGGTGKSPLARWLAAQAVRQGRRPAILLRGYKAGAGPRPLAVSLGRGPLVDAKASGDEAQEHALAKGVAVWVDADRARSARAAVQKGADLLVLDDGFQRRWQLARDLDLLLADWGQLMAGERLLPAGPWREPWNQARLADAILVSGAPSRLDAAALGRRLPPAWRARPCFRLDLVPTGLSVWPAGRGLPLSRLKGARVAALSGLGRPGRFERSLGVLGAQVQPWRFPDHHRFSLAELAKPPAGVRAIVTTRKDAQRLPGSWHPGMPVWVLEAGARVTPEAPFRALVRRALRVARSL